MYRDLNGVEGRSKRNLYKYPAVENDLRFSFPLLYNIIVFNRLRILFCIDGLDVFYTREAVSNGPSPSMKLHDMAAPVLYGRRDSTTNYHDIILYNIIAQ